jgi:hypothetical protein
VAAIGCWWRRWAEDRADPRVGKIYNVGQALRVFEGFPTFFILARDVLGYTPTRNRQTFLNVSLEQHCCGIG